jgi:serine/threonine-protein kinase
VDGRVRQLVPGEVFAGCEIESLAGYGGMGLVYKARQLRPDRLVAVKVIMPELADDGGFRTRFEREASLAAQIEHPNVIPIYDVGDQDGLLYIVMRFIDGMDLGQFLRSHGRLAPGHAAQIISQIAAALDASHQRGLVHRDVKPANVLVTGAHREEHLYLTDFGLTKRVTETRGLTATGDIVGTLDYIAPEQISGESVDARADVYSLGCLLYQLVTGSVPYPLEGQVAKIFAHLSTTPPAPSSTAPSVPVALDRVVAQAMAKQAVDRYQSAGDLARAAIAATAGSSERVTKAARGPAPGRRGVVASSDITEGVRAAREPDAAATTAMPAMNPRGDDQPAGSPQGKAWPLWQAAAHAVVYSGLFGGAFVLGRGTKMAGVWALLCVGAVGITLVIYLRDRRTR